jgi:hypothetical protein
MFYNTCHEHKRWRAWRSRHSNAGIVDLNTESLSPELEMAQDLMTIVPCFSSRL